jgi:hypothetical protein
MLRGADIAGRVVDLPRGSAAQIVERSADACPSRLAQVRADKSA